MKLRLIYQSPSESWLLCFKHSDFVAQLLEYYPSQWLGQNISQLIFGADVVHPWLALFNTIPNEVVPCVNVFAALMEDGILA